MPRAVPQSETSRPTAAESEARITLCRQLIAEGYHDGEVKRMVAAHFHLSTRTVERYLRRARDLIIAETGKPKMEHRATSLAFYQSVRADRKQQAKDRLRAQERIDKLLGLEAPTQVEHSGPDGGPIPVAAPEVFIVAVSANPAAVPAPSGQPAALEDVVIVQRPEEASDGEGQ